MFTEDQAKEFVRLVEETDLPLKEIAAKLGLSYNTFLLYKERSNKSIVRRVIDKSEAHSAASSASPVSVAA